MSSRGKVSHRKLKLRAEREFHAPGYYTPDVRELEPELEREDWDAELARAGAEDFLHTGDFR